MDKLNRIDLLTSLWFYQISKFITLFFFFRLHSFQVMAHVNIENGIEDHCAKMIYIYLYNV